MNKLEEDRVRKERERRQQKNKNAEETQGSHWKQKEDLKRQMQKKC